MGLLRAMGVLEVFWRYVAQNVVVGRLHYFLEIIDIFCFWVLEAALCPAVGRELWR